MMKNFNLFILISLFALTSYSSIAQSEQKAIAENMTPKMELPKGIVNLDVAEFKQKMNDKNVVILDVRTPAEVAEGMISGAIEIDVTQPSFKEKIQELDKDKIYLVYCRSGRRSAAACGIMEEEGFENLNNLIGGFMEWNKVDK